MERKEIEILYHKPLLPLIFEATEVHKKHHKVGEIQVAALISFKTGGCPEDCKYCSQSSHYPSPVKPEALLSVEEMKRMAANAKANGATRICIGAAWREVKEGKAFDTLLEAISEISAMGVEVCCTLGMLTESQAQKLKKCGLYAYNHNLDTSKEFYSSIVTTRTYEERLKTLDCVEKCGLSVCCGAILGMGESDADRISFLHTLRSRTTPPDSIPINMLIPMQGTPLEKAIPPTIWEVVRMIATTRILFPKAKVRLSAGRHGRSVEEQALCFLAGANSIHAGEKLLTAKNFSFDADKKMF